MATKSIKLFFAISIIFYILLGFYLWFSIYTIRSAEFEKAAETASFINSEIDSAYSVDLSFSSVYFRDKSEKLFDKYESLSGILLYSNTEGLQYIKLKSSQLLANQNTDFTAEKSSPELLLSHPFMKQITTMIYFPNGKSVQSNLVFDLLDRAILFPVLRNTLLIALAYLVVAVIVMSLYNTDTGKPKVSSPAEDNIESIEETDSDDFAFPASGEDEQTPEPGIPASLEPHITEETSSGMYSDRSGLVWEHFLSEKLDAELKRAASFDQDSCLAFVSILSPSGFIPYRNISELIVEHFGYKDLAFESGDHTFCIILPEKDIDEGQFDVEKFKKSIKSRFPESGYRIYAGITSRNSRLLSEERMIKEAKSALARAERDADSTTIAFRTDLNKYREYIATKV